MFTFIRKLKIPKKEELKKAIDSFSKKELYIFIALFCIFIISALLMLQKVNNIFMVEQPSRGGTLSEGIIGTPRFINPILAISDADKDLTALIYSGLMRKMPDGDIIPDLAEKYEISSDGLIYTFILKENIFFHDKEPIAADDVVFTINQAKDSALKSPRKLNWEGVTVQKIDDRTVEFTLKAPYAGFLENTTLGILPAHIWKNIPLEQFSFSDFNVNGIGSGPYKVRKIKRASSGVPEYYELIPWSKFNPEPWIGDITLKFYLNEKELVKGLESGNVQNINGISSNAAKNLEENGYRIETTVLPRVFGLFFNQSQAPIFLNKNVVAALNAAVNKDAIIQEVLNGYAVPINSPIPSHLLGSQADSVDGISHSGSVEEAKSILAKDGWKVGKDGILEKKSKTKMTVLEFSISTGDTPELKRAAELLKADFEKIGAKVDLKIFEIGSLNQDVIRPRKYDALFFGQVISHESDLFAFWHSSQRNDPGLNIAMYTNSKADKLLEDSLSMLDKDGRIKKYLAFQDELEKDEPAIFIYSPNFIYVVAKNLGGLDLNQITAPSDRWNNVFDWYTKTENIWKIFKK